MSALERHLSGYPPRMTVEQVADILRVATNTGYRWAREGRLPAYRVGTVWIVVRQELLKHLEATRGGAAEASSPLPGALEALFEEYGIWLGVADVAAALGVSEQGVYKWLREGTLPGYRMGGSWRVLRPELISAVRSSRTGESIRPALEDVFAELPSRLTTAEVAAALDMKTPSVSQMLRRKHLPGYQLGEKWLILREELIEWVMRGRNDADTED